MEQAKAMGMRRRLAFILALAARLTTMGSMRAAVPVLLTKAPKATVQRITSRKMVFSLVPAMRSRPPLIFLASPVWKMAPPTTNRPTIMITTELEKPERASSGVRTPKSNKRVRAQRATMSERNLPTAKQIAEPTRMASVMYMSVVGLKGEGCHDDTLQS